MERNIEFAYTQTRAAKLAVNTHVNRLALIVNNAIKTRASFRFCLSLVPASTSLINDTFPPALLYRPSDNYFPPLRSTRMNSKRNAI